MKEFFALLKLAWENRGYRKKLTRVEQEKLGSNSWYRSLVRALKKTYRWRNPFVLSRSARGKIQLPQTDLIYGETPIGTAYELLASVGADHADHVIELGGGTSVFSLVAAAAFGSRATSMEIIPGFVKKTRGVANSLGLKRVKVMQKDILTGDLPEGTIYYLTGTTFSKESWNVLQKQMAQAPVGAKAISLSVPLDSKAWKEVQRLTLPFSWGENTVYVQTRI